jgi:predicted ABC-type transport system involved in lysophospholipase L1 biosynthesis ATPase subunit
MSDPQLSRLRARRVGFVFQQFFLLDGLSAWWRLPAAGAGATFRIGC